MRRVLRLTRSAGCSISRHGHTETAGGAGSGPAGFADGQLTLLAEPGRIPAGFADHVGAGVTVPPETGSAAALAGCIAVAGCWRTRTPPTPGASLRWSRAVPSCWPGQTLCCCPRPARTPWNCRNTQRHIRDAVAEIRFLAWLTVGWMPVARTPRTNWPSDCWHSGPGAEHFQEVSFDTISAAGANAAMCHYNHPNVATPARRAHGQRSPDRQRRQHLDGTTDITRTVAIGDPGDGTSAACLPWCSRVISPLTRPASRWALPVPS